MDHLGVLVEHRLLTVDDLDPRGDRRIDHFLAISSSNSHIRHLAVGSQQLGAISSKVLILNMKEGGGDNFRRERVDCRGPQ